jgi:hypothetical protein
MSKNKSERVVIIGASESGKTTCACTEFVPHFDFVYYLGPESNIHDYKRACHSGAEFASSEDPYFAEQILKASEEFRKMYPDVACPPQLIVLDDVIDEKFMRSDVCMKLFRRGRHYNISTLVMSHTPNTMATPGMKGNCTQIIICQYYNTDAFETILNDYLIPLMDETGSLSKAQARDKAKQYIKDTVKYKYAKVIIRPLANTYDNWFPEVLEERTNPCTHTPFVPWVADIHVRATEKDKKIHSDLKAISENLVDNKHNEPEKPKKQEEKFSCIIA